MPPDERQPRHGSDAGVAASVRRTLDEAGGPVALARWTVGAQRAVGPSTGWLLQDFGESDAAPIGAGVEVGGVASSLVASPGPRHQPFVLCRGTTSLRASHDVSQRLRSVADRAHR